MASVNRPRVGSESAACLGDLYLCTFTFMRLRQPFQESMPMDRVLSVRVDESVIHRLDQLMRRLGGTKKALIEKAIARYAEEVESETGELDVFTQTFGAWERTESVIETTQRSRGILGDSLSHREAEE